MEARALSIGVQTTTRRRWQEIITKFPPEARSEYRRIELRHVVAGASVQAAFEKLGRATLCGGTVLNVSQRGVQLRLQERLSLRTTVLMRLYLGDEPVVLVGRVTHCTLSVGAYKIGLELQFSDEPDATAEPGRAAGDPPADPHAADGSGSAPQP